MNFKKNLFIIKSIVEYTVKMPILLIVLLASSCDLPPEQWNYKVETLNTDTYTDSDTDADTDSDTDSDTDADTDSDTDADTDSDTGSDTDSDTGSDTDILTCGEVLECVVGGKQNIADCLIGTDQKVQSQILDLSGCMLLNGCFFADNMMECAMNWCSKEVITCMGGFE